MAAQGWDGLSQQMDAVRQHMAMLTQRGTGGRYGVVVLPQDGLGRASDASQLWVASGSAVFASFSDKLDQTADDYRDQAMEQAAQAAQSATID